MDLPITQYGGRMGKDEEGNDLDDDFISSKVFQNLKCMLNTKDFLTRCLK